MDEDSVKRILLRNVGRMEDEWFGQMLQFSSPAKDRRFPFSKSARGAGGKPLRAEVVLF